MPNPLSTAFAYGGVPRVRAEVFSIFPYWQSNDWPQTLLAKRGLNTSAFNALAPSDDFKRIQCVRIRSMDAEIYKVKKDAFTAVANGTYPSPPARFENLATKGKPSGLTLAFIEWILTDGQQYLEQAGYVPLTPEQQAESLAKLK